MIEQSRALALHERILRRMDELRPDRYCPDGAFVTADGRHVPGPEWMAKVATEFADEIDDLSEREMHELEALTEGDGSA